MGACPGCADYMYVRGVGESGKQERCTGTRLYNHTIMAIVNTRKLSGRVKTCDRGKMI